MKILNMTYKILKKDVKYFLLIIFEVVVVSIIFMSLIGKIQVIKLNSNFEEELNINDGYYFTRYGYFDQDNEEIQDIFAQNKIKQLKIYDVYLQCNNQNIYACGYTEELLNNYKCKVKKGKWFENKKYDYVPAIGIDGIYKVGDEIYCENKKIVIIGLVDKNQFVINFGKSASSGKASVSNLLQKMQTGIIVPYECTNMSCLTNKDVTDSVAQMSEIILPDEQLTGNQKNVINQYGDLTKLNDMVSNYKCENRDFFVTNIIIFVVFILITLAGIGGINCMLEIKNERRITIYYMYGLTKVQCIMIQELRTIMTMIIGYISFILTYFICIKKIFVNEYLLVNAYTFTAIAILIVVIFAFAEVPYIINMAKRDMIEIYTQKA
ncbi:hypothetical protein [Eubacterium sp.]